MPISLIYGEKDKPFFRYAQKLHSKLPQNEIIFVEGIKHQLPTKAAGELNKLFFNLLRSILANGVNKKKN